jgi:magnesium transporter
MQDIATSFLDIYLSMVGQRTNRVMQVLTIIATIFIPLTFITGIYGMNFEYMPGLKWHWGYPLVLLAMMVLALLMLLWFKTRKWI